MPPAICKGLFMPPAICKGLFMPPAICKGLFMPPAICWRPSYAPCNMRELHLRNFSYSQQVQRLLRGENSLSPKKISTQKYNLENTGDFLNKFQLSKKLKIFASIQCLYNLFSPKNYL
jgi:hypothetical protein